MATYTSNYQLKLPATTDIVDIDDFNGNAETLDAVVGELAIHALATYTGTALPAASLGRNNDIYIRKIGGGGTKKINTLNAGDLVKLNENGTPKKYIFLEHDHYGEDEVTLLRKGTVGFQAYNVADNGTYPGGNNVYAGSLIDLVCNTQFIQQLDPIVRRSLVNVEISSIRGEISNDFYSNLDTLVRKCFLLSLAEVGIESTDGSAFSYFTSNTNRIAYFAETNKKVNWWLRTPSQQHANYKTSAYYVLDSGETSHISTMYENRTTRPALALTSELIVSTTADSDGCYTVIGAPAVEMYRKADGAWKREA